MERDGLVEPIGETLRRTDEGQTGLKKLAMKPVAYMAWPGHRSMNSGKID